MINLQNVVEQSGVICLVPVTWHQCPVVEAAEDMEGCLAAVVRYGRICAHGRESSEHLRRNSPTAEYRNGFMPNCVALQVSLAWIHAMIHQELHLRHIGTTV